MEPQDVPPNTNEGKDIISTSLEEIIEVLAGRDCQNLNANIIESVTSIQGIVSALARHGCSDITSFIDFTATNDHPSAGGRLSDVYRGALHDGTKIALKLLRVYESSPSEGGGQNRKVLKHTSRVLYHWSKLKHRNVLSLMGLAVFKGRISMITEWMENGNLTSYLRQKPGADRIGLCMDVCAGLAYIHLEGMVHGDLKGANIMISPNGTAMIAGFGNAQLADSTVQTSNDATSIRWAAPERLNNGHPSKEADIHWLTKEMQHVTKFFALATTGVEYKILLECNNRSCRQTGREYVYKL